MTDQSNLDYFAMSPCDMLQAVGDDASKWADAYCQIWPNGCTDHATMLGWFANAIEYSSDVRRWRREAADGN